MRRFFSSENLNDGSVVIRGEEFHHLKNVIRLEKGEHVEILDGHGHIGVGEIVEIAKSEARVKILTVKEQILPSKPHLDLVLCISRFPTMDLIAQKAVELGVHSILPVVSEKSFFKKASPVLNEKVKRWRKISHQACKQAGRTWPLNWGEISTLKNEADVKSSGLFLYEGESTLDIKSALGKFETPPESLRIFIGAEGGFSLAEVESFKERGFQPITLGPLVLRVETACIAICSVIQYHFDLMR